MLFYGLGDSRGFGFLEFKSVLEAREWKERNRVWFELFVLILGINLC